jgi:hypothetical protein
MTAVGDAHAASRRRNGTMRFMMCRSIVAKAPSEVEEALGVTVAVS